MTVAIDSRPSPVKRTPRDTIQRHRDSVFLIGPGVALAAAIATAAKLLHTVPGMATFSPMILAIAIGIAVRNLVGTPSFAHPGIAFSMRRLLRLAIVLLGFQITLTQLAAVGSNGLFVVTGTLLATFGFTLAAGRALGVDRKLTELIAAGTSICGASAIVATNSITAGSDEDVAYAIACVTIFGSIAMFVYPVLPRLLHLDSEAYGLWSGASIHEIAQVAAASFQNSQRAGEIATVAKLARVMLLAPVVLGLSVATRVSARRALGKSARPPLPWFAVGFVAVTAINSVATIPPGVRGVTVTLSTFVLDHRAGLPVVTAPLPRGAMFDREAMTTALAAQAPLWEPGTQAGYHIHTQGFLLSEICRRVTGKTMARFFRDEIALPLKVDYQIGGLTEADQMRCAELQPVLEGTLFAVKDREPDTLLGKAFAQNPDEPWPVTLNSKAWREAEISSANGHGNARAVARIYATVARGGELDGVRLLSPAGIERMRTEQHNMTEVMQQRPYHQGLGVLLNTAEAVWMGPNPKAFGHRGIGGSLGMADPEAKLGVSYSVNRMHARGDNGPRARRLIEAVYASL